MRKLLTLTLASIALLVLVGVGVSLVQDYRLAPAHGTMLLEWDATAVYYQGYRHPTKRGTYGLEYECVELANRFLVTKLGHRNLSRTGHAVSYFTEARAKGLTAFPNGGTEPPMPDDLLVFETGRPEGHVAVIVSVSTTEVTIIQQNATARMLGGLLVRPLPVMHLAVTRRDGRWYVHGFGPNHPIGWARPPQPPE